MVDPPPFDDDDSPWSTLLANAMPRGSVPGPMCRAR